MMNEQIVKMLKDNIRKTEADLAHWHIELGKRAVAAEEAAKFVNILSAGLTLLKQQLDSIK